MNRKWTVLAAVTVIATGCSTRTDKTEHPTSTTPAFSATVDNPWFPLKPGTTLTYRGIKDGKPSRDVFTITRETTVIDGVRCAVVRDSLYLAGALEEKTTDWYTQDRKGNVWYYGEDTETLDPAGHVTSTEGSWRAGKNGARPGVFMPAKPSAGQAGQQEFYAGHAEDHFQVLDNAASVKVPAITTKNALLTKEWTPLEPGVVDHKYYVRGIGTVLEQAIKGDTEVNRLISIKSAP